MKPVNNKYIWPLLSLLAIDLVLFGGSNAQKVSSFLLIVGLLMLALNFYLLIYGLLAAVRLYGLNIRRKRRLSAYMTCLVGGLVAWQSIGEFSRRDMAVLLPLISVGYLYSFYSTSNKRKA